MWKVDKVGVKMKGKEKDLFSKSLQTQLFAGRVQRTYETEWQKQASGTCL